MGPATLDDTKTMKTNLVLVALLAGNLGARAADFVAHEWGTFTSVQGADGIQLEWNPLVTTDLPKFVYDRNRPNPNARRQPLREFLGKSAFVTLQRMETPVIYFYADEELTVDVNVRFPQGIVTEWYPQTTPDTNSRTRWDKIAILPGRQDSGILPNDGSKTHYYAARETDAALLRIPTADKKVEHEKFLFYRGVGSFRAPLIVTTGGNEDYLQVHNAHKQELRHLLALQVHGQVARLTRLDNLRSEEQKTIKLNRDEKPIAEVQTEIAAAMRQALVAEGLYEREAAAMVETWRDSWFGEQGVRVLYVLPRDWTDGVLPLSIEPRPRELVRVMVGRAEVVTPSMEWELMKQIVKFSEGDPKAVASVQALGMGRFADAAVRRMLGRTPSTDFSRAAWNLLDTALRDPASAAKIAAK
jgi:hypothetical protein